jgi:hypothetical protein
MLATGAAWVSALLLALGCLIGVGNGYRLATDDRVQNWRLARHLNPGPIEKSWHFSIVPGTEPVTWLLVAVVYSWAVAAGGHAPWLPGGTDFWLTLTHSAGLVATCWLIPAAVAAAQGHLRAWRASRR